ncbi:MAG: hypothetical protein KJO82_04635 [Gammaproteobacteria bacterium]|nr:hypothetical protein [Gammaproteobacteria bacterium]
MENSQSRSWDFDVYLNDSKIGEHRFEVSEAETGVREVSSNANFDVKVLFVNVYRYRHETTEVWNDGCLAEIASSTEANGKDFAVTGERTNEGFLLKDGENTQRLDGCVMTFAYWNPEFLKQEQLLDPQTGKYVDVNVEQLESMPIEVDGETINADRYRVKANKIEVTVWYAPGSSEWLRLESPAKGGRTLSYRLS